MKHSINGVEITPEQALEFKQDGISVRCFVTVRYKDDDAVAIETPAKSTRPFVSKPKQFLPTLRVKPCKDPEKRLNYLKRQGLATDHECKIGEALLMVYDDKFSLAGFALKGVLTTATRAFMGDRGGSVTSGMTKMMRTEVFEIVK